MSSQNRFQIILNDRVEFKTCASEYYLRQLWALQSRYDSLVATQARFRVELTIDGFLAEIIGTLDSMLFRMNDRLNLGIRPNRVTLANVIMALRAASHLQLLNQLEPLRQPNSWYAVLFEQRNHAVHRTVTGKHVAVTVGSDAPTIVRLPSDPLNPHSPPMSIDILTYFSRSLCEMKNLIETMRNIDPRLR